jgi:hypothetical protein
MDYDSPTYGMLPEGQECGLLIELAAFLEEKSSKVHSRRPSELEYWANRKV